MGTNAQVTSLRQQIQAARGEAAQARRERDIANEYLHHAHQRIDKLEAEGKQAEELGNLMLSAILAAQELTGMVPGQECWPDLVPEHDQKTVSHEKFAALMEAVYKLNCFAEGRKPVGV